MDFQEILSYADDVILEKTGKHLNDLQQAILEETLQGHKYQKIANQHQCSVNYVREVAAGLWKLLSEETGEKITQSNLRTTLERALLAIINSPNTSQITQTNNFNICDPYLSTPKQKARSPDIPYIDLDDAPSREIFYGRRRELNTLENLIVKQQYQLIAMIGLAGIGKTALTLELIEQIKAHFEVVIWRNLRYFTTSESLQEELLSLISDEELTSEETRQNDRWVKHKLRKLINLLQKHRCLIILDNLQLLLSQGQLSGIYQPQSQDYHTFFQSLGEVNHNSCIVINSWEASLEMIDLTEKYSSVHIFPLLGLGEDSKDILQEKGLGNAEKWDDLIQTYQGHPLYLKQVANGINELFRGKITINEQPEQIFLPEELRLLLQSQIQRLSSLELDILTYLSNQSQSCSLEQIREENQGFSLSRTQVNLSFR